MKWFLVDGKRISERELDNLIKTSLNCYSSQPTRTKISIDLTEGEKILNVGCGIGLTSSLLAKTLGTFME